MYILHQNSAHHILNSLLDALTSLTIWGFTEGWLVLSLGSLPPLRPLFVDITHRISYYGSHYQRSNSNPSSLRRIRAGIALHSRAMRSQKDDDSESDGLRSDTGIIRTTRVEILNTSISLEDNSHDSFDAVERGFAR